MEDRNNKGQFQKGHNKGRKKGVKNKSTQERKNALEALFNSECGFDSLFTDIKAIKDPFYRLKAKLNVMEFFMAKHKAIEVTGDDLMNLLKVTVTGNIEPPIDNEEDISE